MKTTARVFLFAVHHLRWLACAPGLPHLFDTLLVVWTGLAHRPCLQAMETLEAAALRLPGVRMRRHRYGGIEFFLDPGGELGHLHGHGLLDVLLDTALARQLVASGRVLPHHVLPDSGWASCPLESPADVPFALELLHAARERISRSRH